MNTFQQSQISLDTSLPGLVHEPLNTIEDQAAERWSQMTETEQCAYILECLPNLLDLNEVQRVISKAIRGESYDATMLGVVGKEKVIGFIADEIRGES